MSRRKLLVTAVARPLLSLSSTPPPALQTHGAQPLEPVASGLGLGSRSGSRGDSCGQEEPVIGCSSERSCLNRSNGSMPFSAAGLPSANQMGHLGHASSSSRWMAAGSLLQRSTVAAIDVPQALGSQVRAFSKKKESSKNRGRRKQTIEEDEEEDEEDDQEIYEGKSRRGAAAAGGGGGRGEGGKGKRAATSQGKEKGSRAGGSVVEGGSDDDDDNGSESVENILSAAKQQMQAAKEAAEKELAKLRTGRAMPEMLDHVMVDAYGLPSPLPRLATISVKDPQTLSVTLHDPNTVSAALKGIASSPMALNPTHDAGAIITVPIPKLTQEVKQAMVKLVGKASEAAKVSIRRARKEALDAFKAKGKSLTEDNKKRLEKQVQDLVTKYTKEVDSLCAAKEKVLTS